MKQYDHEPTMTELFAQLEKEYAYVPDFLPPITRAPIIKHVAGKFIKKAMVDNVIDMMFT